MIITIDGPSGTGKSTVAKEVAKRLDFTYLDTGAMYRSFALFVEKKNIAPTDQRSIRSVVNEFDFQIKEVDEKKQYFIGKENVTLSIRSEKISEVASMISAYPFVRKKLVAIQRRMAKKRHVVCEGRDMGSVVFPEADLKIYLTASAEIRAKRRWDEIKKRDEAEAKAFSLETILKSQEERDRQDSKRKVSPLTKAKGAIEIDTSDLSIEEVAGEVIRLLQNKAKPIKGPAWLTLCRMPIFYRMVIFLVWCFFKIFYRNQVYGRQNFCLGQAILAANHCSFLDPPLVAISSPMEINFLARKSLFKPPFFGLLIRALNSHPVSRGEADPAVFRIIFNILSSGKKILLFPEGQRSSTGEIQPFKEGIGFIAYKSKAPIVPIYVHGTMKIWSRKRKLPRLFGKTACIFGTPIYANEFTKMDRKTAQKEIISRLEKAIHALKKWYEDGAKGNPP